MELLERYLAAVARHAPANERVRIVKLVRSQIEAQLANRGQNTADIEHVETILSELGPPNRIVNQYLRMPRYIIGPAVYEAYWQIMALIFWTVVGSLLIASVIEAIFNGPVSLLSITFIYLTGVLRALSQAFFWVTLVFIVFERRGVRIDLHTDWHPSHLPPVSKLGGDIPKIEPVIGLVITTVAFAIFYFAPQIIGLYYMNNGDWQIISIFNLEALPFFLPLFLVFFASSSAREVAKLMSGQWNYAVLFVTIVCNLVTVGVVALIVFEPQLWNPNFVTQFQSIFAADAPMLADWQNLQGFVVLILAVIATLDTIISATRVWKLHQAPPFLSNNRS